MKLFNSPPLLVLALFCALLAACSPSGRSSQGGEGGGGSVVGNGMKHYQSAELGIAFDYPHTWTLTESGRGREVRLENSIENPARSFSSYIEFSLAPELDGKSFRTTEDLKTHLDLARPRGEWKPIEFSGGQSGFFYRSTDKQTGHERAEYHLLDQNRNVLSVTYEAMFNLGDTDVVRSIIGALSIDFEAPLVERMYFEPAQALPGETVKVVFEGYDLIGAVTAVNANLEFLTTDASYRGWFSWIWRTFSVPSLQWERGNRYVSEFKVPALMPAGEIAIAELRVIDGKENAIQFKVEKVENEHNHKFHHATEYDVYARPQGTSRSRHQQEIGIAKLTVLAAEGVTPDEEGPRLVRAWFQRSLVTETARDQKLYLELKDRSVLRKYANVRFSGPQCLRWSDELVLEGGDIYSVQLDFDTCFSSNACDSESSYCLEKRSKTRNVGLIQVMVLDEVGNPAYDSMEGIEPRPGFMVFR